MRTEGTGTFTVLLLPKLPLCQVYTAPRQDLLSVQALGA